jgi:hypothetical protein
MVMAHLISGKPIFSGIQGILLGHSTVDREVERMKTFAQSLAKIRVLWRAPDTADLWGLPYDLREGQTPYDLFKASTMPHPTRGFLTSISDWVWLGQPGWWGHLDKHAQEAITVFLEKHAAHVPKNAPDFSVLPK